MSGNTARVTRTETVDRLNLENKNFFKHENFTKLDDDARSKAFYENLYAKYGREISKADNNTNINTIVDAFLFTSKPEENDPKAFEISRKLLDDYLNNLKKKNDDGKKVPLSFQKDPYLRELYDVLINHLATHHNSQLTVKIVTDVMKGIAEKTINDYKKKKKDFETEIDKNLRNLLTNMQVVKCSDFNGNPTECPDEFNKASLSGIELETAIPVISQDTNIDTLINELHKATLEGGGTSYTDLREGQIKNKKIEDIDSIFENNELLSNRYTNTTEIKLDDLEDTFDICTEIQKYIVVKFFELNKTELLILRKLQIYYNLLISLNNLVLFFQKSTCDNKIDAPSMVLDIQDLMNRNADAFNGMKHNSTFKGGSNSYTAKIKMEDLSEDRKGLLIDGIPASNITSIKNQITEYRKKLATSYKQLKDSFAGINDDDLSKFIKADPDDKYVKNLYKKGKSDMHYKKGFKDFNDATGYKYKIDFKTQQGKSEGQLVIFICHELTILLTKADQKLRELLLYVINVNVNIKNMLSSIIDILSAIEYDRACFEQAEVQVVVKDIGKLVQTFKETNKDLEELLGKISEVSTLTKNKPTIATKELKPYQVFQIKTPESKNKFLNALCKIIARKLKIHEDKLECILKEDNKTVLITIKK